MRKLDKSQTTRLTALQDALTKAEADLSDAVSSYNEDITRTFEARVVPALDKVNSIREEIGSLRDEVVSEMDNYISERSEKWAESEAAGQYEEWKNAWEELETEAVEVEPPEAVENPDGIAEDLQNLPLSASG